MHENLLKLAKRLQKFTLDEFAIIAEMDESEVIAIFKDAKFRKNIYQKESTYFYSSNVALPNQKKSSTGKAIVGKTNFAPLKIEKMQGYDIYLKTIGYKRKHADKCLRILSACWNLNGVNLKLFTKQWNKAYPNMRVAYATIMNWRKKLRIMGLEGIIPNYGANKGKSVIENELYEHFKEFYLSFGANSYTESIKMATLKFKKNNSDVELQESNIPSVMTFKRRLLKEFSQEEISTFRQKIIMPKVKKTRAKKIKKGAIKNRHITFKKAAVLFEERAKNIRTKSSYLSIKNYLNNHLIPVFGKHKLKDITKDMINNFRDAKIEEGFSLSSANSYSTCLEHIIKFYLPPENNDNKLELLNKRKENFYSDIRILEVEDIRKLLNVAKSDFPDFYPLLLTAITTGLTRGEILGLTWDCVDLDKKLLNISKSHYRGATIKHRTKTSIRELDLIDETVEVLKEHKLNSVKSDFVFPNLSGNAMEPNHMIKWRFHPIVEKAGIKKIRFLDLRDTYASLLIEQNLPLTYIQKQLGVCSVDVIATRYKKIFDSLEVKVSKLF